VLKKLLNIFYDIREGEWKSAGIMFALHFLLMVILYFLKPARDSLFLVETGPDQLPLVYIILALVSLPVTYFVSDILSKYNIRSVIVGSLGFLALNLLVIRWLFYFDTPIVYMFFYIWVGIFGILVISLYWILANNLFNVGQSKRLFSFLTLSAILGSIAGSEASSQIVSTTAIATQDLLYICVGLIVLAMGMMWFLPESEPSSPENEKLDQKKSFSGLEVARSVFKSKYQIIIAGIIVLTTLSTTFTDYQFKVLSHAAYPLTEDLTAFMGTFYAGISLGSFLIQVLFSSGIIKKFGLTGAVLTRPAGMFLGAILMAIEPVLASVIILNGVDGSTRYSIDKTGRELLFLPLSQNVKERTKVFIDLFLDRFARGVAGLILMVSLLLVANTVLLVTYLLLATIVAWIWLGYRAKKEYVNTFRNSLQKSLIDTDSIELNLNESSVRKLICESLHSDNNNQVLHTLIFLKESDVALISDTLIDLLDHQEPEIRLRALQLLQTVKSEDYIDEVESLLRDIEPDIRVEAIYYLGQRFRDSSVEVIEKYKQGENRMDASAALDCATKKRGIDNLHTGICDELLQESTSNDDVVIRALMADSLAFAVDKSLAAKYLKVLLKDHHKTVVRKAIHSISEQKIDRLIPDLIQKLNDKSYTVEIRKTLASYGPDYLALYKTKFFERDLDHEIRKQIPGIFYYQPVEQSVKHLMDMLEVDEPDLRYHVIKTLSRLKRKYNQLEIDLKPVRKCIRTESENFFNLMAVKVIQPQNHPNRILLRALTEKMNQTVERIFRLLGLIYDQKDMYSSYLAYNSLSKDRKSASVEFLDNLLSAEDLNYVFPIVDTIDDIKKMRKGSEIFDIEKLAYDQGLKQLIDGRDKWLKICAIYSVSPVCPAYLQQEVELAAKSDDSLIKETALMVEQRNSKRKN
jgi:ATP/ADP translocase/HEAT repeat protein